MHKEEIPITDAHRRIVAEDISKVISSCSSLEEMSGKTVLITGASGMLPSAMVDTLLSLNRDQNRGIKIIGLVRNITKAQRRFDLELHQRFGLQLIAHDVSVPLEINQHVDYIIHAASQASPKYYGVDPVGTIAPNVFGTKWLLDLAVKHKATFLFFSSGEVYGKLPEEVMPVTESTYGHLDPMNVRSCYGESKRLAETLCVSYHKQYGAKVRIVRPFHTYGPGMPLDDGRVFADFVSDIVNRRDIQLASDGSALRPYCYLSDATSAFFKVLLKGSDAEAYNVGNPDAEISVKELADTLVSLFPERGLSVKFVGQKTNYMVSPISRMVPSIEKISNLGWKPTITIKEGFKRTIQSYE